MADIYFVGLGLSKRFLTNASLEVLKGSDVIYADIYTSISCDINEKTLREITGKEIIPATREVLETKEKEIYKLLDSGKNVAIAVVGDPMIATTHVSLATGARARGHRVSVIPGVSVHCYMISRSMLSSYKFGKSVTVTFPVLDKLDYTPYRVIKTNRELGLHTMVYLDLKETGIMTADLALNYLKKMESDIGDKVILDDDLVVIGERLGCADERVRAMKVVDALNQKFGAPPHIIIVPSRNLYEMEVEGLKCLS
ncbi:MULTISPECIES: diphthine synthase [Metallosphaera]|uniref:Diphthine synthase n=3 Tax=Metallosphaera TaxID=41980 RepID=DPHB_METS5|nr:MULTISPECIES: diphthine synthase [Metallosphaera]A4YHI8.1 RecName: Full=Diphthine synthase; AltName: Full=Diphthamide biosynthesis methyltransferase [Metallosphaera sedula DSM 5348]ABP95890.1 diphthine synthase [Metallosphaera sedula DSM 5348]AIM27874.1 diphthine synthase [Metallosphaera sedula]AKV74714.1 diphthine synthase [Metallosphaera sedula]AKV76952.1 diphthine synthase [Metallosphaera sedula]AKV79203.1 diphthine synthase [Metallosphaera sedula]